MKDKKIFNEIEIMRVIAMICVVLQHSMAIYAWGGWFRTSKVNSTFFAIANNYLATIHIYSFVFISGYLFYFLAFEKKKYNNSKEFVIKKIRRLLIPYIVIYFIWLLPISSILDRKINIADSILSPFIGINNGHLWFLFVLFELYMIFRFCIKKIDIVTKSQFKIYFIVVYFAYLFANFLIMIGIPQFFQWYRVIEFSMFFLFGCYAYRFIQFKKVNFTKIILLWIIIGGIIVLTHQLMSNSIYNITLKLLKPIQSFFAILVCYCLSCKVNKNFISNSRLFKFLHKNNFKIYLLQEPIIYFFAQYFYNKEKFSAFVVVGITFIMTITISSVILVIYSKLISKILEIKSLYK